MVYTKLDAPLDLSRCPPAALPPPLPNPCSNLTSSASLPSCSCLLATKFPECLSSPLWISLFSIRVFPCTSPPASLFPLFRFLLRPGGGAAAAFASDFSPSVVVRRRASLHQRNLHADSVHVPKSCCAHYTLLASASGFHP